MMSESINIICLDVPYPADYGGVIDIFYKIKALHNLGIHIHLHCFEYGGRRRRKELNNYCASVHYYPRKTGLKSNLSLTPYITYSRRSDELLKRLNENSYPILMEGVHSLFVLLKDEYRDRTVLLRSHNVEHEYYQHLANREQNPIKKLFFQLESYRLRRLLRRLPSSLPIAAISVSDTQYLTKQYPNTFWLPPFHSNQEVETLTGTGDFALYHGNLSVSENSEVAEMLVAAFSKKTVNLVIAGKAPSHRLKYLVLQSPNIRVVPDPAEVEMIALIRHAHVVLLPTYQATGIKLKLIESLYRGRFCVANQLMVANTKLEDVVTLEETDFYGCTERLMGCSMTEAAIERRRTSLNSHYTNWRNGLLLLEKMGISPA